MILWHCLSPCDISYLHKYIATYGRCGRQVMQAVEELYHLSWITRQQQINLEGLILSRTESTPAGCCRRDTQLQAAQFIDSYKQLGPIVRDR